MLLISPVRSFGPELAGVTLMVYPGLLISAVLVRFLAKPTSTLRARCEFWGALVAKIA
jgi:hypothetical protein